MKKPITKKPSTDARLSALESGIQTILDLVKPKPALPRKHGTIWHAEDLSRLNAIFHHKKGFRPKQTLKEIADLFERTELAVFWKAQDLSLISEENASYLWRGK